MLWPSGNFVKRELCRWRRGGAGGLLGREENLTIPWQEIETIGTDAVLVHTQLPSAAPSKPGLWQSLRARLGL